MAFTHGSVATFAVDAAGGSSYTDLSVYLNEVGLDNETDTAETTVLGKIHKTYIPGLLDDTFSLSGLFDPTVDAFLAGIQRDVVSFRYRPAGAGTGLPEYTGLAFMTSYSIGTTVDEAATIEAEFQVTDTVTRAAQA